MRPEQLSGVIPYLVTSQRVDQMSGLAGEVAIITSLQESTHNNRNSQSQSPGNLQRVVSGDGQVETRLADVSLHPMNRLTGSSSKEFGIKQLDDIWRGGFKAQTTCCVCGPTFQGNV